MSNDNFLGRLFKAYCKFSFYENQVALIEGRNYILIYAFYESLVYIKSSSKSASDIARKLTLLEKGVEQFILCLKNKYDFLKDINTKCEDVFEVLKKEHIIDKFNSISELFDEFVESYMYISKFVDSHLNENMLIEFNNFLSYFLNHIKNDEYSVGLSHLYRGSLDGYKDIILNNKIILLSNISMRDDLVSLRIDEMNNVGKLVSGSYDKAILQRYKTIATADIMR
jgi:hypothetical protein